MFVLRIITNIITLFSSKSLPLILYYGERIQLVQLTDQRREEDMVVGLIVALMNFGSCITAFFDVVI